MAGQTESLPISALILSRDAEETIGVSLESVRGFSEVVVYDNGSTDRTMEIAREFPNVSLHRGEFSGFGPTLNRVAGLARNDWVFMMHADESVTAELLASLAAADLSDPSTSYSVLRGNYMRGKLVRHSGWGGDWLVRLYDRRATQFNDAPVHEVVLVPEGGQVVRLIGELSHDALRELSGFLAKIDYYSELRRVETGRRVLSPPLIVLRSLWAFVSTYFLKLGILDGWRGLVIAVCDANGVFFKYMKPYADYHD